MKITRHGYHRDHGTRKMIEVNEAPRPSATGWRLERAEGGFQIRLTPHDGTKGGQRRHRHTYYIDLTTDELTAIVKQALQR